MPEPSPHHKALILAAGIGSRLAPITEQIPKSLVPVNGMPIILRQIRCLMENDIRDITVVTGYRDELLRKAILEHFPNVDFIHNREFRNTNNMVSAYLAREKLHATPFLLMNADVFFDPSVITGLVNFPHPNAVVTQVGVYYPESMKVTQDGPRLQTIAKNVPPEQAFGTSIDLYRFSTEAAELFFRECGKFIEEKQQRNLWAEVAINEIFKLVDFRPCPITGRWYEIDTIDDLHHAEQLFNQK